MNCNAMVQAIDVACAGVLLVAHERRVLLTAAQRPTAASQPYADSSTRYIAMYSKKWCAC